jgi:hypothetical protein
VGEVKGSVGIDLLLKDFAAAIDGRVIAMDRHYRKLEGHLGNAQCALREARARAIQTKIKIPGTTICTSFPRRSRRSICTISTRLRRPEYNACNDRACAMLLGNRWWEAVALPEAARISLRRHGCCSRATRSFLSLT